MSKKDRIVEQIRRIRNKKAAKFDYDISAICDDIRKKQTRSKNKLITSIKQEKAEKDSSPDILQAA